MKMFTGGPVSLSWSWRWSAAIAISSPYAGDCAQSVSRSGTVCVEPSA